MKKIIYLGGIMLAWLMLFLFPLILQEGVVAADASWPMLGHNPAHTGISPYSVPTPALKRYLEHTYFESAPVLGADNTMYANCGSIGLIALNMDGSQKWAYPISFLGSSNRSSPVIGSDGTIYTFYGRVMYAINTNGKEKWHLVLPGSYYDYGNGLSPVMDSDGTIYYVFGSNESVLYAITPSDTSGTIKWSYPLENSRVSFSSPAIGMDGAETTIYLVSQNSELLAIDNQGQLKWKVPCGGHSGDTPVIDANGTVYTGSSNQLWAVNSQGTEKWCINTGLNSNVCPAIGKDGTIYAGFQNDLLALNPDDGATKWTFAAGGKISSAPIIDGQGIVYVTSDDGCLYALDPATKTSKWSVKIGRVNFSPVINSLGNLYLESRSFQAGETYLTGLYMVGDISSIPLDLTKWNQIPGIDEENCYLFGVAWTGSKFIAVGSQNGSGVIFTSSDGLAWTAQSVDIKTTLRGVATGASKIVITGDYGLILTIDETGTHETRIPGQWDADTNSLWNVCYGNGQFVVVGQGGQIFTSSDGITWTRQSSGTDNSIEAVVWNGSKFVAVGMYGAILTSWNGSVWYDASSDNYDQYDDIAWNGSKFVISGHCWDSWYNDDVQVLRSSDDCKYWSKILFPMAYTLNGVTWDGSEFVAVGSEGSVYSSTDADDWAYESAPTVDSIMDVASNGRLRVAVGHHGLILVSKTEKENYLPGTGQESVTQITSVKPQSNQNTIGAAGGDPVDTATGACTVNRTLFSLNGAEPLTLEVSYNSLLLNDGPLGKGWGHQYETRLEETEGKIIIHWSANRSNEFIGTGDNSYSCSQPSLRFDRLLKNNDGTFTLTSRDGRIHQFTAAGQLDSIGNGHGQLLKLSYDSSDQLISIAEPLSGVAINLHYNYLGLIDNISDSLNRSLNLTYNSAHLLTMIIDDQGHKAAYTYDSNGRVLTAADENGKLIFSNTYDFHGRVASQQDSARNRTTFSYAGQPSTDKIITTVTDREGNNKIYTYDSNYHMISLKDELGNTTTYTYDHNGNCTSTTDEDGNITSCTYDEKGKQITTTDAAGNTTTMTYDNAGNILSIANPAGKKITFTYDSNNNVTAKTDPLGNLTAYTYNQDGQLLSISVNGSTQITNTYQNGLLAAQTDGSGITANYRYDAAGRLTAMTDAAGYTTSMIYDNDDNLIELTDPLGNTATYTYDSHHNRTSATDARGNTTYYYYNENFQLAKMVDALNNSVNYYYNKEDRLEAVTDARGNRTSYTYDEKGRLTQTMDPLYNSVIQQYDNQDNVIGIIDGCYHKISTIKYDQNGNPLTVKDALGNIATNQYDSLDRLVQVSDPAGGIKRFGYDDLNHLTDVTDASGSISRQSYDEKGNLVLIDGPKSELNLSYDAGGRLIKEVNSDGDTVSRTYNNRGLLASQTNGRGQTTTFEYDAAGHLARQVLPEGTVEYTYNKNGNLLTISDSTGMISRTYDELNRVTSYTGPNGYVLLYSYDANSNLTGLTYPGGKEVRYEYDECNRLVKVSDWSNRVTAYQYDENGRLIQTTRSNGTVLTFTYDNAGRVVEQKDVDSSGGVICHYNYTYDKVGNIISEQAIPQLQPITLPDISMSYGNDNRLLTFNSQAVTYDHDGNMTSGPLDGGTSTYEYDSRNRLITADNNRFVYDAAGNLIATDRGNNREQYVINPQASLSQILENGNNGINSAYIYGLGLIGSEVSGSDGQVEFYTYHFDLRGSTVAITDNTGQVIDRFQYSPYGTLTGHEGSTSTPFLYNGRDGVLSISSSLYNMRSRFYNTDTRRFINQDVLIGNIANSQSLNRYAFVEGCPVNRSDPSGLFLNFLDPLIENTCPVAVNITPEQRQQRNQATDELLTELFINAPKESWDYNNKYIVGPAIRDIPHIAYEYPGQLGEQFTSSHDPLDLALRVGNVSTYLEAGVNAVIVNEVKNNNITLQQGEGLKNITSVIFSMNGMKGNVKNIASGKGNRLRNSAELFYGNLSLNNTLDKLKKMQQTPPGIISARISNSSR